MISFGSEYCFSVDDCNLLRALVHEVLQATPGRQLARTIGATQLDLESLLCKLPALSAVTELRLSRLQAQISRNVLSVMLQQCDVVDFKLRTGYETCDAARLRDSIVVT